jgi:ferredoxin-type protein NapH
LHRFLTNWKRRTAQAVSLAVLGEFSFYGVFRCPFAIPYVSCGSCPVLQCPGRWLWWSVWIGMLGSVLLFGRSFCSWCCPASLVSELFGQWNLFGKKLNRSIENAVYSLRPAKYVVLIICLVFLFWLGNPRWAIPIRTGPFFGSVSLTFKHANMLWIWRSAFILAGLGLAMLVPMFWCRFLCPTAGILDIFHRFSFLKYSTTSACNDCDKCRRNCPNKVRPTEWNCTNCGDCSHICPKEAVRFGYRAKRRTS